MNVNGYAARAESFRATAAELAYAAHMAAADRNWSESAYLERRAATARRNAAAFARMAKRAGK